MHLSKGFKPEDTMVMNEYTYGKLKEKIFELAPSKEDPIGFVGTLASMNIIIDNTVHDGVTEFWNREVYYAYKEAMGESLDEEK